MTTSTSIAFPIAFEREGVRYLISNNNGHPESYLWLDRADMSARFFLGNLLPGMQRADVAHLVRDLFRRRRESARRREFARRRRLAR